MGCVDDGDTAWMMISTVLVLGMIPGVNPILCVVLFRKHSLACVV